MQKEISIYIHLPFCHKKCPYCHFLSFEVKDNLISDYLNALSLEMKYYKDNYSPLDIKTIYIGGGTPSLLNIRQIDKLFSVIRQNLCFDKGIEISFESNPKSLDIKKLMLLKSLGVNRLSIGAQSFKDYELKFLGRIHSSKDIYHSFALSRKAGFENINFDFIFALPGQTMEDLIKSLTSAVKLGVEHVSLYNLTIEKGSSWFKNKKIKLPDNDIDFKLYQKAINFLIENKYIHYEISNFSKKGQFCKHNTTYWKNEEYVGLGLGAHSYFNSKRYSQTENLKYYINNPIPKNIINSIQTLSEENKRQETMFLNLRLLKGLNINLFKKQYNYDPYYFFNQQIKELKGLKLIKEKDNYLKLSRRGLYLANEVFEKFI